MILLSSQTLFLPSLSLLWELKINSDKQAQLEVMKTKIIAFSAIYCEITEIHTSGTLAFPMQMKHQYFGVSFWK